MWCGGTPCLVDWRGGGEGVLTLGVTWEDKGRGRGEGGREGKEGRREGKGSPAGFIRN